MYGIVNSLSTLPALFWIDKVGRRVLLMAGAVGTCISLVIVGGIIGAYGSDLVNHKAAGWAGIAFIYIYDINFSYSFGTSTSNVLPRYVAADCNSANWMGSSVRNLQPVHPFQGHLNHHIRDMDVQLVRPLTANDAHADAC